MLIPPTKIPLYFSKMTFPTFAHTGGALHKIKTQGDLLTLCDRGAVIATGSYTKIRRLQIILPNPKLLKSLEKMKFGRMMRSHSVTSEAGRTVVRQFMPEAAAHVWRHHDARCAAWPHTGGPQ